MRPATHPNPQLRQWRRRTDIHNSSLNYRFWRGLCQFVGIMLWHVRAYNRHYEPADGSVLYVCNHQSFLDPMLMALALRRPMNFMARDTLFSWGPFRRLIKSVYAFPVRRGTADLAAIKEAMRRLRAGGQLCIFAEGTRTRDGHIGPFLPGFAALAQRAADWTIPVVIDGAFEAWPRGQSLPSAGRMVVQYGKPIPQAEAREATGDQLVARIRNEMIAMQADVRARLGRPALKYED